MMVRHQCIPLDTPSDWKEALKGVKHAFAHTWENCYAIQLTTGLKTYLYHFEAKNIRIVCPISERPFENYIDIVTPYGLSGFVGNGDFPDFPHYWNDFVKDKGYVCGFIGLNPIFENSIYFDLNEARQYNSIYVLDLTLDIDEIFANLSINRKRQLKHWRIIFSDLILEKDILIDFFLNNYHAFFHRVSASQVYYFFRETLSFLFNLENVFMVGAGKPEKVEAVSVFAYTPYGGDFLFNVSLPEGQHHSAALLWYTVNYLKSLGVPHLNLGGGIRENDGVAQFKQRFGGKKLALRCLKQVYEPEVYEKLCQQANVDPNNMTGYFPPYRRP